MRFPRASLALALLLRGAGCTCSRGAAPTPTPTSAAASASTPPQPDAHACPSLVEVAPGLVIERVRAPLEPPVNIGDRCITLVRVDPARYRFRLLTGLAEGGSRPVTAWAARFHLTGVTNASMFLHSGKSTGLLVSDGAVNNGDDNPNFGGFLAFDPTSPALPAVAFFGRDCPGVDLEKIRQEYRSIVQNYRLLDCDGRAIPWRDEKVYSTAALGFDGRGRMVFLHTRTPFSMTRFSAMIASPALDLRAALFVEGGPEASLFVDAGGLTLQEIGSYETGFVEDDSNHRFWDLPNVIGFSPR